MSDNSNNLRKYLGPAIAVAVAALLVALSNRSVITGTGVPVLNDGTQYNDALKKSQELSLDRIHRYDAGESMTPEDKVPLMQAVKLTDGLSLVNPTEFGPYYLSGRLYVMLDDYERADERLKQCVINGKNLTSQEAQLTLVDAHYLRSIALVGLKQYQTAFDEANAAATIHPDSPNYLAGRASVYIQMNKIPQAKKDLAAAIKLDPNHIRANQLLKLISVAPKSTKK